MLALVGIAAWLLRQEPAVLQMAELTPATPMASPMAQANPADAAPAAQPGSSSSRSPAVADPQRTAVPSPDDTASVAVAVTSNTAANASQPLPFVDVQLEVEDRSQETPLRRQVARTGSDGVARFSLRRAEGLRVIARTSVGGEATATVRARQTTELQIRVEFRVFLAGTVTDIGGRGVANAELLLLPWTTSSGDHPAPGCIGCSGADGAFHIGLALGGRIGARHRSYGPSPMHLVRLAPADSPPTTLTLQLVLEATSGRIEGTVCDAAGAPIADAELEFRSAAKAAGANELAAVPVRVTTDANGAFVARDLRTGPIDYGVRATGHGCLSGRAQVTDGAALTMRLQLGRACLLTGTVIDEAGRAAQNARVTAGAPTSFVARSTRTDLAGRYQLTGLGSGPTELLAQQQSPSGARLQATALQQLVSDRPNEWNATLLSPENTVELRGSIVGRDQQPLAGFSIVARHGPRSLLGTSLADGSFVIAVPVRSLVDVRAYAPGQPLNTFADTLVRGIDPAAGPVRLVGGVGQWGQVLGRVTTQTQLAVPATIGVWHHERAEYVSTTAGTDGAFTIAVPAGHLDCTFEHPGYAAATRADQSVGPNEPRDLGTIQLGTAGILHGVVRGADGSAPEQCQLVIVHQDQRLVADYGGGTYRFASVPTGQHVLQVQSNGLAAATFRVVIDANAERQLDIDLRVGRLRRIRVTAPPPGVDQIALALRPPEQSVHWMSAQSSRAGSGQRIAEAEFEAWLQPGTYEAIAWSGTRFEARTMVQVGAADTDTVTLELQQK